MAAIKPGKIEAWVTKYAAIGKRDGRRFFIGVWGRTTDTPRIPENSLFEHGGSYWAIRIPFTRVCLCTDNLSKRGA